MTQNEFMYDHDYSTIVDLLNRHMEFHGMAGKEENENEKPKASNPKEFFI